MVDLLGVLIGAPATVDVQGPCPCFSWLPQYMWMNAWMSGVLAVAAFWAGPDENMRWWVFSCSEVEQDIDMFYFLRVSTTAGCFVGLAHVMTCIMVGVAAATSLRVIMVSCLQVGCSR